MCKKAKQSVPVFSQGLSLIWLEFGMLLRLVGLMNLILFLSDLIYIQGRELFLSFFKNL